ncbi:hypothetical protein [Actinoplanes sp. NPDC026619]|uniref:hypothetical protein n=1 Tax=Actinoplanes sp. NPDC026619 TaxID=3155798 RepID=UPI003406DDAA
MTACLHTPGLILGLLADLGDTPAAVAAALHNAGITGRPDSADRCPIAYYLFAHTGAVDLAVSREEIWVQWPDSNTFATTPAPIAQFIARFDARQYPNLTRPEVRR